jgi:predicted GIY-YIG superfamily endonuclease
MGQVYLICFDENYKHAKHYIGYAENDAEARLEAHKQGYGAKLLRVLNDAGIGYKIVRVWENVDRHFERKLKNEGHSKRHCPCCGRKHGNKED